MRFRKARVGVRTAGDGTTTAQALSKAALSALRAQRGVLGPLRAQPRRERAGALPLVREHFAAFAEQVQEGGSSLPRYVVAEFEAFVRCGVLACGFLRAHCAGCGHDRLVAFSCKHRHLPATAAAW